MESLAPEYSKNTFNYSLIERKEDVAIYSQTLPETGKIIAYEVFEVQKYPERTIGNVVIPAREAAPGNEQWGKLAFTVHDLSDTYAIQAKLIQQSKERVEKRQNSANV